LSVVIHPLCLSHLFLKFGRKKNKQKGSPIDRLLVQVVQIVSRELSPNAIENGHKISKSSGEDMFS
jgi:hypothetical protein